MYKALSSWIQRVSTGKVTLVFLLIFLIFMAVVLPDQASKASQAAGDADSPDTSFFYSSADLYRMAEAYGQSGRDAYVRARFTFDLAWPLVYTAFLCTSLSWLNRKALPPASPWQRMNLVPLLAFLFDLLENISTSLVMWSFPGTVPLAAALAPFFTLFKWIFVTSSFILLLVAAGLALWRSLSPRLHRGS